MKGAYKENYGYRYDITVSGTFYPAQSSRTGWRQFSRMALMILRPIGMKVMPMSSVHSPAVSGVSSGRRKQRSITSSHPLKSTWPNN